MPSKKLLISKRGKVKQSNYQLIVDIHRPEGLFQLIAIGRADGLKRDLAITCAARTKKGTVIHPNSIFKQINDHELRAIVASSIYVCDEYGR
jgi:hypothetical protein